MFEEFLANGNLLSIALMVYVGNVMMEALRRDRLDPHGINTPHIIKSPVSALIMVASIPCAILPAIYIGTYSGWVAGLIAWVVLQVAGGVLSIVLGIRGALIGFHFILATIALPIGYFLCLSDMFA
ncbi:hypothetical protein JKP23_21460 [Vibrio vulnificus]|uniref:hypothetical protein n=1 Tax=Vibrio vulnificus TaxID=672 RepID=UPI001CDCEE55|nr:hypothetical protein [Vibrio vulnificus]MCA3899659.1 hypothetical protein [Vibrio vulnificus]